MYFRSVLSGNEMKRVIFQISRSDDGVVGKCNRYKTSEVGVHSLNWGDNISQYFCLVGVDFR